VSTSKNPAIEFLPPPDATPTDAPEESENSSTAPVQYRVLTQEEVASLVPIFDQFGGSMPDPNSSFFLGAVAGGEVVGFLVVQLAVHAEPLWVRADYKHIMRPLIRATEEQIARNCGPGRHVDVFAFVPPGNVARTVQEVASMRVEPWMVLSKRVGMELVEPKVDEDSDSEKPEAGGDPETRVN